MYYILVFLTTGKGLLFVLFGGPLRHPFPCCSANAMPVWRQTGALTTLVRLSLGQNPEAEFMNVQFRCRFWAQS